MDGLSDQEWTSVSEVSVYLLRNEPFSTKILTFFTKLFFILKEIFLFIEIYSK